MRIYKTRADFTKLQAVQNPSIFAGTICTITDEALNPMYVFQGGVWNSTVTATTNPLTGGLKVSTGGSPFPMTYDTSNSDVLTKFGKTAYDITLQTVNPASITNITSARSTEKSRFGTQTLKLQPTADTGTTVYWNNMGMTCDPDDLLYAIDVYIDTPILTNVTSVPLLTITLSNNAALGANYSQWIFDNASMRQGWNTLKMWAGDDTSGGYRDSNMPMGVSRTTTGTGFDFTQPCQYFQIRFSYMSGATVYADQVRRGAKAKTLLTIGFDASMPVFTSDLAPLFNDHGVGSYFTTTWIYNGLYAGGASWEIEEELYRKWGWDALNHTWNHGGTIEGRTNVVTLARVSNVITVTFPSAHSIPVGKTFKAKITGATPSDMNGYVWLVSTGASAATYTAVGADGAGSGTIKLCTLLSELFDTVSAEDQRLVDHEIVDTSRYMKSVGMGRTAHLLAWPNNAVPHLTMTEISCAKAGVAFGRGGRHGNININEFGIDNPLHFGAWAFESSASLYTKLSTLQRKIAGAKGRGDCIHLFGHFILDETAPENAAHAGANLEYPPGQGGNAAPPALGATNADGGWWYLGQIRALLDWLKPQRDAGEIEVSSYRNFAKRLGYKE